MFTPGRERSPSKRSMYLSFHILNFPIVSPSAWSPGQLISSCPQISWDLWCRHSLSRQSEQSVSPKVMPVGLMYIHFHHRLLEPPLSAAVVQQHSPLPGASIPGRYVSKSGPHVCPPSWVSPGNSEAKNMRWERRSKAIETDESEPSAYAVSLFIWTSSDPISISSSHFTIVSCWCLSVFMMQQFT